MELTRGAEEEESEVPTMTSVDAEQFEVYSTVYVPDCLPEAPGARTHAEDIVQGKPIRRYQGVTHTEDCNR